MLHGVLRERAYELYVFIIAILVVLVYCIVEYAFLNVEGRTTVKLVSIFSEHYRNMFYNYGFSAQYYHKAGIKAMNLWSHACVTLFKSAQFLKSDSLTFYK